ncbi:hypothetical protein AVV30_gp007 [Vibrio phage phi 1]|uniref:Uncharacterized protein n=1 Tax=Vibrio phage phi 1 TaxID=1589297 RepID=A0A0B5HDV3_9CAUD|nr:hypothetical protein AVV30_gp007 [Vibrio phage phi 1]AJF40665.1 hypothetical protein SBVP1_0007 [Vibrio phage phi 1]
MTEFYFKIYKPTYINDWCVYSGEAIRKYSPFTLACYTANTYEDAENKVKKYHPNTQFKRVTQFETYSGCSYCY